ncbi:MAG: hypothetical protein SGBAC_008083 [Bacillariaceae sp.]
MTEAEESETSPTAIKSTHSDDTADILAELDELADTAEPSITGSSTTSKPAEKSPSNAAPAPAPTPASAPAPAPAASSSNVWSWNSLAEGLTSNIIATAEVEAVMDGENTDLGATKADIQEMESAIASAEEVVSSVMFSAFSSVTETLGGTASAATGKKKKTKKKGGVPVDDSDLDALTRGPSGDTEDIANNPGDSDGTETDAAAATSAEKRDTPADSAADTSGASGWTSWTDSLATDLTATTTSILPNFPAPPALDKDGNEIPQKEEEGVPLPSASEAVEAASSSLWSAFSAVSDTIMQTASNESTGAGGGNSSSKPDAGAQSSNMLLQLYTSKVNQAAEWIEELENEENDKDPYKHLKQHLKDYIQDYPTGTYEGWIQKWVQEQGWGEEEEEQATTGTTARTDGGNNEAKVEPPITIFIDPSYYKEESIHRTFWNEKNYADGIEVDDENAPRKYVEARGASAGKRVSQ